MILRNYYNMLASACMAVQKTDTTTFGDGHINVKTTSGSIQQIYESSEKNLTETSARIGGYPFSFAQIGTSFKFDITSTQSPGYAYYCFGSGNTPVSYDDYTMSQLITSGLSLGNVINSATTYNTTTKKWEKNIQFDITNTSSDSITISEIGIVGYMYTINYSHGYPVLLYREVLETPITMVAGERVAYIHKVEFTMPTIA